MSKKSKNLILIIIVLVLLLFIRLVDAVQEHYYDSKNQILLDNELKSNDNNLKITVYVCGAVKEEDLYELDYGSRLNDLLKKIKLLESANIKKLNLAENLKDGQKIYIPYKDEEFSGLEKISLEKFNTLDKEELMKIDGIGEVYAERILEYRNKNGLFKNVEELLNVKGIGEKKLEKIKKSIVN